METIETDIAVIGAGPAGLSAALEAANAGAGVLLLDENRLPGGQLFKQIHKFFGSSEHGAGIRGYKIGYSLLEKVKASGADIMLDTLVYGIFDGKTLGAVSNDRHFAIHFKRVILAAGAKENYLAFPGSTLPGVMGAGAAQTMANLHRVLPGKRIVMVGSGNVGLIVAYQLLQVGAEIEAIVEAAPEIGGYDVHAAKLRRAGVPIYVSHTVQKAFGRNEVEGVVLVKLDTAGRPVPGSEKVLEADTVCLAVGLNPLTELAWMSGCRFSYVPRLGGHVPLCSEDMETTVPGFYAAGDIKGVEEASVAMEEGSIAGLSAAESLGAITAAEAEKRKDVCRRRLMSLRAGSSGNKLRDGLTSGGGMRPKECAEGSTEESVKKSAQKCSGECGEVAEESAEENAGESPEESADESSVQCMGESPDKVVSEERLQRGRVAVIECRQNIPCNPCEKACPYGAIQIGDPITNLPVLDEKRCMGCGKCVAACPGLAIFILDMNYAKGEALVEFPYEYLPLPVKDSAVHVVDRDGRTIGDGRVVGVKNPEANGETPVVAVAVPNELAHDVRSIERNRDSV